MMKTIVLRLVLFLSMFAVNAGAQTSVSPKTPGRRAQVCSACIRAHEEFLASDALRGRGSATPDELVAATYIAAELRQYGIAPAGDHGGFLQRAPLVRRKISGPPQLAFKTPGNVNQAEDVIWKHGEEMVVLHLGAAEVSGKLQKAELGADFPTQIQKGAVVFLRAKDDKRPNYDDAERAVQAGAALVVIPENPRYRGHWKAIGEDLFSNAPDLADASGSDVEDRSTILVLARDAAERLNQLPDGTVIRFTAAMGKSETAATWNVIGEIRGTNPSLRQAAVLLSAHLDHLGIGPTVKDDSLYNGADDDASGTTAVLELARVLGSGPKPRRTVIFALFGSEELGGLGSTYFREHPPLPLPDIAANLEFEMIGRSDPAVAANTLWLTGWERSNLGPTLAAHGAHLVGDPHPDQNFFARSDNYVLAKKGVVAQTVSSYGMHADYHQPSDDVSHLDFKHMDEAIGSLLGPIEWLVNSSFKPEWKEGGKP